MDEANEYASKHGLRKFDAVSNNISLPVPAGPFHPGLVSAHGAGEEWHKRTGTPLLSWSSQARGFFSGRYSPELRDQPGAVDEHSEKMMEVYGSDDNFARLRRAEVLGREKGACTAMEIALAWVLHLRIPVIPVVGPRTREELRSCVRALSIELSESEMRWLNLETDSEDIPL